MANPTTNFGWQMPTATDLVTDLPADFEVFGQAVDTDFVDLLGGTTGQILSKASDTDLDFTWISDATGMANPMTTTGDVIYSSSGSTPARLGIGTVGQVLQVNSGATAPEWADSAGGGKVLQVVQGSYSTATTIATTTFTDTDLSLSITPTLATSKILVIVNQSTYIQRDSAEVSSGLQIVRGATTIFTLPSAASAGARYIGVGGQSFVATGGVDVMTYLDSPATTSATTYKTQAKIQASSQNGSLTAQPNSIPSTITLLEIGA
jgi:hypothetical protein